jgi:hypothetical protein
MNSIVQAIMHGISKTDRVAWKAHFAVFVSGLVVENKAPFRRGQTIGSAHQNSGIVHSVP